MIIDEKLLEWEEVYQEKELKKSTLMTSIKMLVYENNLVTKPNNYKEIKIKYYSV